MKCPRVTVPSRIWILLTLTKHCSPIDKAKTIMPLFLKRKLTSKRTAISLEGAWSVNHKAKRPGLLSQMSIALDWSCRGPVTSSGAGNQLLKPLSQHQTSWKHCCFAQTTLPLWTWVSYLQNEVTELKHLPLCVSPMHMGAFWRPSGVHGQRILETLYLLTPLGNSQCIVVF